MTLSYLQDGGKLVGVGIPPDSSVIDGGGQGASVAINGDGTVLVSGAPFDDGFFGEVFIWERILGVWNNVQTLTNPGDFGGFGGVVAISDDGDTILVSAPGGGGNAYVYFRETSTWDFQQELSTSVDEDARYGYAVALSADGNTALIGAPQDGGNPFNATGNAFVWTRTVDSWAPLQTINGSSSSLHFGARLDVSSDASTLVVAGSDPFTASHAEVVVYAFGSGQYDAQQIFSGSGNRGAVALSGNGDYLLIGDPLGAQAALYLRVSGSYGQFATLTPLGLDVSGNSFPVSAKLTDDGQVVILGTGSNQDALGAVWVFAEEGGEYVQQGDLYIPDDPQYAPGESYVGFGDSVDVTPDGNAFAAGGPYDDESVGAAWVFGSDTGVRGRRALAIATGKRGSVFLSFVVDDAVSLDGIMVPLQ